MKKIFGFILCFLMLVTLISPTIYADSTYLQDFSDINSVRKDFSAYYVYTLGGGSEEDMIYDSYNEQGRWYLESGSICRKSLNGDVSPDYQTDSIGVLTLTKRKYVNFELTVDYCSGDSTHYWPVIAFRQNEPGRYHLSDGAGVFVQNGGKVTLWGTDGIGGPYETQGISGYENNTWHTLKIKLDGINLSVYVDDSNEPNYKKSLNTEFFRMGYISLISVNNECKFKNLKIEELPITPLADKYQQAASLDTISKDSLNVLAGNQIDSLNELDYVGNNIFNTNVLNVTITILISIVVVVESLILIWPSIINKIKKR